MSESKKKTKIITLSIFSIKKANVLVEYTEFFSLGNILNRKKKFYYMETYVHGIFQMTALFNI